MVEINWTVFVQIANFLILLFALNIVLFKPIRRILNQRKAKMAALRDSADATDRHVEEKGQAFTDGIKEARLQGQKQKEAMLKAATDEEKEIVARINAKAQEDMAIVKARIEKDTEAVRSALEKEVDIFAGAITQKILGRAA
jgi:F-type H+-transporting ATPase subunit b